MRAWINTQRVTCAKDRLSRHRVAALDELGMVWDVREGLWAAGYVAAAQHTSEHGHLHPKDDYVAPGGFRLGSWLVLQRQLWMPCSA
ncbi:helicase associated domain-containing protein [Micromonospora sp. NPDC047707]|uniref:helicase associated domain-containing protein n=1 Tax=Micromonospora sp. NPDC047707 TaxID=3154498 RepID=UPI003457359C